MYIEFVSHEYSVVAGTVSWFHIGLPFVIASYVLLNISGNTLDCTTYKRWKLRQDSEFIIVLNYVNTEDC